MVITTIDVETDVRRQYNRRVLFCIRIRAAALLIGLWDLVIHSIVLCALIFMFRQPSPLMMTEDSLVGKNLYSPSSQISLAESHPEQTPDTIMQHKNYLSSNILLNRMLEKRNMTRMPVGLNTRNFYSNLDLMTVKWAASLSPQDKCVVFFVVFSATILILAHICGILTNKPSYIVPYFLIKVFNVIISILSMLGFYAYMPDVTVWLRMQPNFPFKQNLLELDTQTLQLVIYTFLLFVILAKLYIAAIIWYCYGYITALTMARSIGTFTATDGIQPIIGEMYSPPKYEEAIKSTNYQQEAYSPPPYTPLLRSTM
ncbi:unnamed protein product [Adineta steineri]|uniref:Lysosomal-associated transmembrane protein 4A n=1 Tax=Adineta steineri TaxID=433720 RepID=A0A813PTW3_9BILA|nr:unnamed protein product [Adineta steineri]CAF3484168.1 unnamed protein product [Adineta steineri]CAF3637393.1 unnamed protein product [Adineta steineri]CAF3698386.1 unnamed protein product [Adineta steineri]